MCETLPRSAARPHGTKFSFSLVWGTQLTPTLQELGI